MMQRGSAHMATKLARRQAGCGRTKGVARAGVPQSNGDQTKPARQIAREPVGGDHGTTVE